MNPFGPGGLPVPDTQAQPGQLPSWVLLAVIAAIALAALAYVFIAGRRR